MKKKKAKKTIKKASRKVTKEFTVAVKKVKKNMRGAKVSGSVTIGKYTLTKR